MKMVLKDKLTFTQTVEIAAERIHDLLTTAFEGGCNYWLLPIQKKLMINAKLSKTLHQNLHKIQIPKALSFNELSPTT